MQSLCMAFLSKVNYILPKQYETSLLVSYPFCTLNVSHGIQTYRTENVCFFPFTVEVEVLPVVSYIKPYACPDHLFPHLHLPSGVKLNEQTM